MAKKRKRSGAALGIAKAPAPWSAEEKATLYGWLDYCVTFVGYSKEDFVSTVCIKLEDKGSIHHDIGKVNSKIRRDWNRYGASGYDFEDIFDHNETGGSLLFVFSAQEKEQIAIAKQQFIHESRTSTVTPTRILRNRTSNQPRSISRTPAQNTQNGSPSLMKSDNKFYGSPSLRKYGKSRRSIVVPLPRGFESIEKKAKKSVDIKSSSRTNIRSAFDPPERLSKRGPKTRENSHTLSVVDDSEEIDDDLSVSALQASVENSGIAVEVKQDDVEVSMANVSKRLSPALERHKRCIADCLFKHYSSEIRPGEIKCNGCGSWQHYACVGLEVRKTEVSSPESQKYYCFECNPESHREYIDKHTCPSELADALRHKLDTAIVDIKVLKEKLLQMESDFDDFQVESQRIEDNSRLQKSVQDQIHHIYQHSDGCKNVEELLQQREEYIKKLEKRLKDRESLGKFTKLSKDSRETFGLEMGGYDGISKVYKAAKQFILQSELPPQLISPDLDQYPELKMLVHAGLEPTETQKEHVVSLDKFNVRELIRFLSTSAVFLWVFNTDFPRLASDQDFTFMNYRDCLLRQDGPTTVRNLDLACYHSLIREKYFRQTHIQPEAEKLAIRFSQALAPLFSATPNSPTESNWDDFSTWGGSPDIWTTRRSLLFDLFQQALELKSELCLNTAVYELVIYPPGTKYDETTMDIEAGQVLSSDGHDVVKICIEAAVYQFARSEELDKISLGPTMRSLNFVQRDRDQRLISQVLVKAVVVLVRD